VSRRRNGRPNPNPDQPAAGPVTVTRVDGRQTTAAPYNPAELGRIVDKGRARPQRTYRQQLRATGGTNSQ
jgi:hypothetical protein